MSSRPPSLRAFDEARRRATARRWIAGLDEVGRGSLAGPVVAACVVLSSGVKLPGVTDSKQLTPEQRAAGRALVLARADAVAWAFVGPRAIDALNIRRASLLAMRRSLARALVRLARRVASGGAVDRANARDGERVHDAVLALVDGLDLVPGTTVAQECLVEGDGRSLAVAAASVVAKTVRDGFMARLGGDLPAYGFERHKGYGTPDHLAALARLGPCGWHRYTFAPVAQGSLFAGLDAAFEAPVGASD